MTAIFQCGFIRCAVLRGHKEIHSGDSDEKFSLFQAQFNYIEINKKHFMRKSKDLIQLLRKKHWHGEERESYMKHFSLKVWKLLYKGDKVKHTLHDCMGCFSSYKEEQNLFPSASNTNSKRKVLGDINSNAVSVPSQELQNHSMSICTEIPITKPEYMVESANTVLNDINRGWNKIFDTPFTKVLTKLPTTNLTEKLTENTKKKNLRAIHRKIKTSIEKTQVEDGRDVETFYGTRQTKSRYEKFRTSQYFETKASASTRVRTGNLP